MRMRHTIAIVTPAFTPAEAFGGPVTAIANLAKLLCKQGYSVKVYTTNVLDPWRPNSNSRLPRVEDIGGVTVRRYRPLICIFGYWITPRLLKDLMTDQYDIINAQCARSFQFDIAAFVAWIRNRKLIATPHGSLYSYGSVSGRVRRLLFAAHNAILKLDFKRASTILSTSSEEDSQFNRFHLDPRKIFQLPNFLDETQFEKLPPAGGFRSQFGIGTHEKVILFLGRLDRIKGLDLLLLAYSRIAKKMDGVWLVIIGPDAGYLETIRKLINLTDHSFRVVLAGPRYGSPKIQALVDSDFVVVPSYYESFGITVLEAYLSRKPVVASRVGALLKLVIDKETGLLFGRGNVDELAGLLEWALRNPRKLELMGDKGRALALSQYSALAVREAVTSLYS